MREIKCINHGARTLGLLLFGKMLQINKYIDIGNNLNLYVYVLTFHEVMTVKKLTVYMGLNIFLK